MEIFISFQSEFKMTKFTKKSTFHQKWYIGFVVLFVICSNIHQKSQAMSVRLSVNSLEFV